ncbi:uncharacterized protein METZ01_LOCUS57484 [marine metagenome]|uniref:Thiol:disulfide interchange protein n=1 Tax=marine metagenome TaxID=408172 RepID=A0A381SKQ4_9ZZZZ
MKKIITILTVLTLFTGHESLKSDESDSPETRLDYKVSTDQRIEEIVTDLLDFFPEGTKVNLKSSPMEGLYAVHIGSQVFYISDDGRFLLSGDIYNTQTSENLTDNDRRIARIEYLSELDSSSMITFSPIEYQRSVTVFTDIDCGYCRKFHQQIDAVMNEGIQVRYIFFPRSGPDTESWYKAQEVWCSADQLQAITLAKLGKSFNSQECSNDPVQQHYDLGKMFNVQGTPTLVTDAGEIIVGYLSATDLKDRLDGK